MKKIALGVGVLAGYATLPEQWIQPIVGNVVLPAHAATSGATLHDPCAVELRSGDNNSATVVVKVTGFVTPPAGNLTTKITATAVGGQGLSVNTEVKTAADGTFEAFLTLTGGPGITTVNVVTTVQGASGTAKCSVSTTPPAPALSFNPCTSEMALGNTQADVFSNPIVIGSVAPLTNGVLVSVQFTGTLQDTTTQVFTFPATTGAGINPLGVYSIGIGPANNPANPFVRWDAVVTSTSIGGSTTCFVLVPAT